jgi:hypothetical protein
MSKRTFWQRQADDARDRLGATGSDDEVLDWAAEDSLKPAEFEGWVANADKLPEYAALVTLVANDPRLYPQAIWDLRSRLQKMHGELLGAPYEDDGQEAVEKTGTEIVHWRIACDRLLFYGLQETDQQARLARIRRPEFIRSVDEDYVDQTIEAGRPADRGAAPVLREFFRILARGGQPPPEMFEAIRHRFDPSVRGRFDRPETFDSLMTAIEDKFLMTGGYRRALLTLPKVVDYLRTTAQRAYGRDRGRDAASGTPSNPRFLEIIRSDIDDHHDDVEPAAQESVERVSEQRDLLQDIETQFLPSLPRAMRADFLAVRMEQESAADVARRTNRSRAAVSKNLAEFQKRLDNFLVQRG